MAEIIRLVDSYTKENVNYEETSTWFDGTVMNDTKVDNVIYRKKGNIFYKRILETGKIRPEWFGAVGDGVTDDAQAIQKALDITSMIKGTLVFQNKDYLIDAQQKITTDWMSNHFFGLLIKSNTVVNFNSANIILKPNSNVRVHLIGVFRQKNISIIGGNFIGDRLTHIPVVGDDNSTLLKISISKNVIVDGSTFRNCQGDGFAVSTLSVMFENTPVNSGSNVLNISVFNRNSYYLNESDIDVGWIVTSPSFPEGTVITAIDKANRTITLSNQAILTEALSKVSFFQDYRNEVHLKNSKFDNNRRNGIVIESGKGISVSKCVIINTNGISPEAGIDIEPYFGNNFLKDVVVERCYSSNNRQGGIFAQNGSNFQINDNYLEDGLMLRGAQNVMIQNNYISGLFTINYSSATILSNKMYNIGVAIYNSDRLTYSKPQNIDIISNIFEGDNGNKFRVLQLFNISSKPNMYNALSLKNNAINLKTAGNLVNSIISGDSRSPEIFKNIDISNNTINLEFSIYTKTNGIIISQLSNNPNCIIKDNTIRVVATTFYADASIFQLICSKIILVDGNYIEFANKPTSVVFRINNTANGIAKYNIKNNWIESQGATKPGALILSPEANGIPVINALNNVSIGIPVIISDVAKLNINQGNMI